MIPIPLGPLGERTRIISKVQELLALCDELEAKLRANEATAAKLVEAVVRELGLSPARHRSWPRRA